MPYLKLQTNRQFDHATKSEIMQKLSSGVSEALGKSENYVMIVLESEKPMIFAGNNSPAAFLELKSLGLPEDQTPQFSATLCELVEQAVGVSKDRIYIEFAGPARHMWGWNSKTF